MNVAEAIPADHNRISSVDMPHERGVHRMEGFDQELVEFETARNQGGPWERPAFGSLVVGGTWIAVEETVREIPSPTHLLPKRADQRMMHTSMQVVYETPFPALIYATRLERARVAEACVRIWPCRECSGVVVKVVNANVECPPQAVDECLVLAGRVSCR